MRKLYGFTLIELIIVVTVIGILAAIAYPAYLDQMRRSRRSDAQTALLNFAALMEHYFTENNTYVGANSTTLGSTYASQQGYYTVSIAPTATTYTLTATPVATGPQAGDTCGALTLTNTNVKGPNPSVCWN